MSRPQLVILSAIVIAGCAISWTIQHSTRARLRERNEARRVQAEQLALLSAENRRLSNVVAQAHSGGGLTGEQLHELLRLRGEVGLLRQTTSELERLRATNRQLLTAIAAPETGSEAGGVAPGAQTNLVYWPRDRLGFAGFADPESAVKTTLWIWTDADLNSILPHCTPEERDALEKVWAGRSEAEMAAQRKRMESMYSLDKGGVSIVGKKLISPDEALLDLYFEGDGKRRRFALERLGDQWTVRSLVAIYN